MKRIGIFTIIGAVAAATIGLGVVASSAFASGGSTSPALRGSESVPAPGAHPNAVTSGSTWTYYDFINYPQTPNCEVLTFSTKTFTGDKGDFGKYKSSAKSTSVTYENAFFFTAMTFKGTFASGQGSYDGITTLKSNGQSFGPEELFPGNDPRSIGGC